MCNQFNDLLRTSLLLKMNHNKHVASEKNTRSSEQTANNLRYTMPMKTCVAEFYFHYRLWFPTSSKDAVARSKSPFLTFTSPLASLSLVTFNYVHFDRCRIMIVKLEILPSVRATRKIVLSDITHPVGGTFEIVKLEFVHSMRAR